MNDDLNTPIVISHLFDGVRAINTILSGNAMITAADLDDLRDTFSTFLFDILGLRLDEAEAGGAALEPFEKAVDLLLDVRRDAKGKKDWATSDFIRDRLGEIGFEIKDTKEGTEWKLK